MRLTEKDIGKKVFQDENLVYVLISINGNFLWLFEEDEASYQYKTLTNSNDWQVLEPPKLPSERIMDRIKGFYPADYKMTLEDWSGYFCEFRDAVLDVLDEQAREKK